MIEKQELIDRQWKIVAYASNGGTAKFQSQIDPLLVLTWHGDNFIYKKSKPEKLDEIIIERIDKETIRFTPIFKGECKTVEEFDKLCKELNLF